MGTRPSGPPVRLAGGLCRIWRASRNGITSQIVGVVEAAQSPIKQARAGVSAPGAESTIDHSYLQCSRMRTTKKEVKGVRSSGQGPREGRNRAASRP